MKVLIVVILMACASGATCFVFYRNFENNNKPDMTITDYFSSSPRVLFNDELELVSNNCNDERIELLSTTLQNFEEILDDCNYYYINYSSKIKNKHEVRKSFNNLTNRKNHLYSMLIEYNLKCANSSGFDRQIGSNDLYDSFAIFLKEYADFIQFLNTRICSAIDTEQTDIKFSIVELYSLVVKDSFSVIITDSGLKTIAEIDNIEYMNNLIEYEFGQLKTISPYFGSNSTNFIFNYNLCDKKSFAENLYNNLDSVNENLSDMTSSELASYYFKEIFEF